MTIQVQAARYHRNGVAGEGFHHIAFREGRSALTAILFDEPGHLAVMDAEGDSWRCEDFEDDLRAFLASDAGQHMVWGDMVGLNAANVA